MDTSSPSTRGYSTPYKIVRGIFFAAIAAAVFVGVYHFKPEWFHPQTVAASVPDMKPVTGQQFPRTPMTANSNTPSVAVAAPSTKVMPGCSIEFWTIPWNATMALHYANGGVQTVDGSLMAKNGVNITLVRQNDYDKIQEAMIKFAEGVKAGEACPKGAGFAVIMGNGYSGFAAGLGRANVQDWTRL